jgi:hypothetical protein
VSAVGPSEIASAQPQDAQQASEEPSGKLGPRHQAPERAEAIEAPPALGSSPKRPLAKNPASARAGAAQPAQGGAHKNVSGQAPEDGEEIRQLVRAEELLAPDPLRALQLVRDGNTRFRRGYLRQERRYLEIMALFALGRTGEAHAHAQWFLGDYPAGPYKDKVELALLRHPLR